MVHYWSKGKFKLNFFLCLRSIFQSAQLLLQDGRKKCELNLKENPWLEKEAINFTARIFQWWALPYITSSRRPICILIYSIFQQNVLQIVPPPFSFHKTGKKRQKGGKFCSGLSSHNLSRKNANAKSRLWPKSFIHSLNDFSWPHWARITIQNNTYNRFLPICI